MRQRELATAHRDRTTMAKSKRLKALERENKELCEANEILRSGSAFFDVNGSVSIYLCAKRFRLDRVLVSLGRCSLLNR